MKNYEVIIVGAGAAGLMCAIEAAKRGRRVLVLDHANKMGKKILISGGGRCNFTNLHTKPFHYLSQNPSFCISALSRYKPENFLELVHRYEISYHEKTLGQLFCDTSSKDIVHCLREESESVGVEIQLNVTVESIEHQQGFLLKTGFGMCKTDSLVIATGGLSFPTMGASGWGYDVAQQFGLKLHSRRAALVPFTLSESDLKHYQELSGLSAFCRVSCEQQSFEEAVLFTHRGLSGPAILQISSYWREGLPIEINWLPDHDLDEFLLSQKVARPRAEIRTLLSELLPKRLVTSLLPEELGTQTLANLKDKDRAAIVDQITRWSITPKGTEGYKTAEVTLGGIDVDELSSKTMESKKIPGLYFIGEVVDVTGHLGGFNFQWAWASGWCAGQYC